MAVDPPQREPTSSDLGRFDRWQNFLISVVLHLGIPLFPRMLEKWFSGAIEARSAALTAALYSMAMGLSSRSVALFGFGIAGSFVFSAVFGFLSRDPDLIYAKIFSYGAIGIVFALHGGERFARHVVAGDPFCEFRTKPFVETQQCNGR